MQYNCVKTFSFISMLQHVKVFCYLWQQGMADIQYVSVHANFTSNVSLFLTFFLPLLRLMFKGNNVILIGCFKHFWSKSKHRSCGIHKASASRLSPEQHRSSKVEAVCLQFSPNPPLSTMKLY